MIQPVKNKRRSLYILISGQALLLFSLGTGYFLQSSAAVQCLWCWTADPKDAALIPAAEVALSMNTKFGRFHAL